MAADQLVAGPMVRRAAPDGVYIWVAMASPPTLKAELYSSQRAESGFAYTLPGASVPQEAREAARIAVAENAAVETRQLGKNLYVSLLHLAPKAGESFPQDEVLLYDLFLNGQGLAEVGLTAGPHRLIYEQFPLPSFILASRLTRILHGSCRKLHGGGEDALANADLQISVTLTDVARRPPILLLTGDQIYADDVGSKVYPAMASLGHLLSGLEPIPGFPEALAAIPEGSRSALAKAARLTSTEAANHAFGFGEYAALYALAWNPDLSSFDVNCQQVLGLPLQQSVARARRAMANTPTYMIFDDHEVTDDWNLNQAWRQDVQQNEAGRRILANGLAAFWAFQGWGNDPPAFSAQFKNTVEAHLSLSFANGEAFDTALWGHNRWHFATPTRPVVGALDLRTMRGTKDNHNAAAELIGRDRLPDVAAVICRAGFVSNQPLLLISPTPVFGHDLPEALQQRGGGSADPFHFDRESWSANRTGFIRFLRTLNEDLRPDPCVILSGDVHYGFNATAEFREGGRSLLMVQLTSSSLKNAELKTEALTFIDIVAGLGMEHDVGWDRPPAGVRDALQLAVLAMLPEVFQAVDAEARLLGAAAAELGASVLSSNPARVASVVARVAGVSLHILLTTPAYLRLDRLLRELDRLSRSDEAISLPFEVAQRHDLKGYDWEIARVFVPVTSLAGQRHRVIGSTNLGDVLLRLEQHGLTSRLLQRKNGQIDDRAQASIRLEKALVGSSPRVGAARGVERSRQNLGRQHPAEIIAEHLIEWHRGNRDESWRKATLEFNDLRLEALPRAFLPGGRGDHVKCQLHSISFHAPGSTVADLATQLRLQFGPLLPPEEAEVIVRPPPPIALNSEFRWLIPPVPGYSQFARQYLRNLLPRLQPIALTDRTREVVNTELDEIIRQNDPVLRRFDVRVVDVTGPTADFFGFTVATLSNHPYGARRSWQIRRGPDPELFDLTTAEFNTYAWLVDIAYELATNAGATQRLWQRLLENFVAAIGGAVTAAIDPTLPPVIRSDRVLILQDTEFLFPETINSSPLGNWIRRHFNTLAAIVDPIFGRPP